MSRVIHTTAPELCESCHSFLLKMCYVGESWIVDRVVCGKCGAEPLKKEVDRRKTKVVQKESDF
jgi:hypothetical protein